VSVDIYLTGSTNRSSSSPIKLSIIEQLDGIDREVHARTGTLWKREDGAFETSPVLRPRGFPSIWYGPSRVPALNGIGDQHYSREAEVGGFHC
jgi:hypothetical protein